VLHASRGRGREDALPVDRAVTHGREQAQLRVKRLRGCGLVFHVLDVKQRETARVFFEVGNRILTSVRHPEAVHFKVDQFRIERFGNVVVCGRVAVFLELEVVIVTAVLNAGLLGLLAGLVEELRQALVIIKGFALLWIEDGIHHIFQPDRLGILGVFFPVRL